MTITFEQPIDVPQDKPESFSTLPDGDYVVVITNFEDRNVSSFKISGRVFDVVMQVVEGPKHGQTVSDFCPLFADQSNMRAWGQQIIAKIAWACGHGGKKINDTSMLTGVPFVVRVSQEKQVYQDATTGEDKVSYKNKIEDYIDHKSWSRAKREAGTEPKSGYQSSKMNETTNNSEPTGYAAGKKLRKTPEKITLALLMPGDERLADFPYEYENGASFAVFLGSDGKLWMKDHADPENMVYTFMANENDEEQTEVKKPVSEFIFNKSEE